MSAIFEGVCEKDFNELSCRDMLGDKFLDPCDCANYYECIPSGRLTQRPCTVGTLWNPNTTNCDHEQDVQYKFQCHYGVNTWKRCDVSEERLSELKVYCTNTSDITAAPPTNGGDGGINAGIVVGLIIAGAVIALVLIALLLLYRRRQKRHRIQKSRPTVQNPEYFEGGNMDDPYAVIDDSMNNPTYNASHGQGTLTHANGTLPPPPLDNAVEDVEYDNSAFRSSVTIDSGGYMNTLRNTPAQEYDILVRSFDAAQTKSNSDIDSNNTADDLPASHTETMDDKHDAKVKSVDENGNGGALKHDSGTGDSADTGIETSYGNAFM